MNRRRQFIAFSSFSSNSTLLPKKGSNSWSTIQNDQSVSPDVVSDGVHFPRSNLFTIDLKALKSIDESYSRISSVDTISNQRLRSHEFWYLSQ